ncbi:hypothetical protein B0T22DRAFT_442431 [Podospora appendiculata]|uniref:Ecp2 effector protein domain-containing protein n=1 Tax=Podospora appendiculata TaxID=314037 RepID=A0AAE0X5I7_9PEZI|nr:hypothetical protein B0T22DRAFT_442431 [Podospora appendiculata]
MYPVTLLPLLAAFAAASPSQLNKRCSPIYDPAYYHGYLPPVACWLSQDTACRAWLSSGTELLIDAKHNLTVVYGVSSYCFETIAEELARAKDGRKTFGWLEKHGKLNDIGDGTLIISRMSADAIKRYQELKYLAPGQS